MPSTTPQRPPLELVLEELANELERIRLSVKANLFGKPAAFETNAASRIRYSVQRVTTGKPTKGKGPTR